MAKKPKILVYIKRNFINTGENLKLNKCKGQLKAGIAFDNDKLLIPALDAPTRHKYGNCWYIGIGDYVLCEGDPSTLPRR